ncbi:dephospho-CoA kinase [Candidatus Omnitrophota bacterium]
MGKRTIGVTGGLATGKTTVADMFAAKGADKIDADEIAHQLLDENEDIRFKVIDFFGEDILAGSAIDRRKLAGKVFSDKENLNALCRIMHPAIIFNIKEQVEKSKRDTIVIDAPLLIEAGLHEYVDIVVVVTAEPDTQIKRATGRGIPEEEARRIIDNQMALSEKAKFADYLIDNNDGKDLGKIKEGVDEIWQEM